MTTTGLGTGLRRRASGRAAAALVAAAIGMGGLAACSSDSPGPGAAAVTTEDLRQLQDDMAALEDRVTVLEEALADAEEPVEGDEPADGGDEQFEDKAGVFDDAESLVGQEVTVSAAVSEVLTTTDVGSAFRIAGDSGDPVVVVMATPPDELDADDVVRVSGTVTTIQRDSFETDFGIAADELFDDPDAFFADFEGEAAIAADRMEVLQEQADS